MNACETNSGSPSGEPSITTTRPISQQMCEKLWTLPAEVGVPVLEVCRQAGITEQTFYRWKKQYVGLEIDQVLSVRQLKQLQEENARLKKLIAELSLDKTKTMDMSEIPERTVTQ